MKTPRYDYSQFSLKRINEERFSHLKLLWGWPAFFILYVITENLIPAERLHLIHCPLDDVIPFHEFFIIPYVLWYLLIFFSLLYFLLYKPSSFKKLQAYITACQLIAMAIYIIYPSYQDLRPENFPRENLLTALTAFLYSFDTCTGVCPSLHCAISIGIGSVWLREKDENPLLKFFICLFCLLVCASTVLIKQHSVLDFFAALPLCILVEYIVFHRLYPKASNG